MDCSLPGCSVLGFPRYEYWSGLSCPSPGELPDPGTEPMSLMSPALAPPGKLLLCLMHVYYHSLPVESKLMGPGIFGSLTYLKLFEQQLAQSCKTVIGTQKNLNEWINDPHWKAVFTNVPPMGYRCTVILTPQPWGSWPGYRTAEDLGNSVQWCCN